MIGTPEEAAARRRALTAERVRRLRERKRAAAAPVEAAPAIQASAPPPANYGAAGERLRAIVAKIEGFEAELRNAAATWDPAETKRNAQLEMKEIYKYAKSTGFEPDLLREVIRLRRLSAEDREVLRRYEEAAAG